MRKPYAVRYEQLIPILLNEIQKLNDENTNIKLKFVEEIEKINKEIANIKTKLSI
jgi:hypothetical protein